jgi:hypothetical protein
MSKKSSAYLRTPPAKPPVITPTVVIAAYNDTTHRVNAGEGDEEPNIRMLPMGTVRMLIRECGVGFVNCRHRIRIGFYPAPRKLSGHLIVAGMSTEFEKKNLNVPDSGSSSRHGF